jgi:hypothetical protein
MFPLIYSKIISEQTIEYAEWRMEQQFLKNSKHIISGPNWDHYTTYQGIIHLYGMLIFMCLFPLPGATKTTYWEYGSPADGLLDNDDAATEIQTVAQCSIVQLECHRDAWK